MHGPAGGAATRRSVSREKPTITIHHHNLIKHVYVEKVKVAVEIEDESDENNR